MKKILIISIILTLGWPGIRVAAQPVQLRIPVLTGTVGTIKDVPIYVDNSVTGLNIISCQFQISFNNTKLSFVSVEIDGTMIQSWGSPTTYLSPGGYLYIAAAGSSALTGSGTLMILRFQCVATGNSSLTFNGGAANNFLNEGTPSAVFTNGSINITSPPSITVSPNTALLSTGETQQFTVTGGTAPYAWSVTNPNVATISSGGLLTATGNGFTKVSVIDNAGITDQTDGDIEIRALKLTIPSTSAWQGSIIDIPINTTSLNGLGIIGGIIKITFNQNLLTPVGYNQSGTLLNGYPNLILNTSVPGIVTLVFAGTTPLTGSGVLINLQFNVSSVNSGSSPLTFTEAIFNENILAKTVNGQFTTINYSSITVTPNTATLVAGETRQFNAAGGITPYTWTTSDNTVAIVNSTGLLTALKSGVIRVTTTDNVGAAGSSGNITIYDTWVSIPVVNVQMKTTYDLPVMMTNLPPGQSVFSVQGTVSYKSPELTAVDIITTGTMTAGWTIFKVITGNKINFAIAGATGFNTAGIMFKIRFQLNPDLTNGEVAFVNIDNITLNEGLPLPRTANGSITGATGLALKVILEGPFSGTNMNYSLSTEGLLPLSQPFNKSPWNYTGIEIVSIIPNTNIIDWVLVELRDAISASAATTSKRIVRQAAFILNDGSIVGMDGFTKINFTANVINNLFVVIWHRNHLGVMSAAPLIMNNESYSYDFTTDAEKAYGGANAHKQIVPGKWGMFSGDGNADKTIDMIDKSGVWSPNAGKMGYLNADFNLDGQVDNKDKNEFWLPNLGKNSLVPE